MTGRLPGGGRLSPSGQPTCPSVGPRDADIVLIGESPAHNEIREQQPFVGQAGRMLSKALLAAGIDRNDCYLCNVVPALAPGNTFDRHTTNDKVWGAAVLNDELAALDPPRSGRRIVVALGSNPLGAVLGRGAITKWRGSIIPPATQAFAERRNAYWHIMQSTPSVTIDPSWAVTSSFHPAAVLRQMPWHLWLIHDLTRAKRYVEGRDYGLRDREWHIDKPMETQRLIYDTILEHEHLVAIDTEMSNIISLVTENEVHVFTYDERYAPALRSLCSSPNVLKVAHNMAHDWRQLEKWYGIRVMKPYYDTICLAHIMEPSGMAAGDRDKSAGEQQVGKSLSPHLATRFTAWPYHKWLSNVDEAWYCGIDSVVAYDAYWAQIEQSTPTQMALAEFDHKLFPVLFDMQRRGILVDSDYRDTVLRDMEHKMSEASDSFVSIVRPVVERHIARMTKPHLFRKTTRCPCCNGGKVTSQLCWRCAGFDEKPRKSDLQRMFPGVAGTKAEIEQQVLDVCTECEGVGKLEVWLPIEPSKKHQIADIFYRGYRVPPRRFEGKETVRIAQLERLLDHGAYLGPDKVGALTERRHARTALLAYQRWVYSEIARSTAERITPGDDGRVRCNFDPWYTPTSRVASREGLLDVGTNLQNIPKDARRLLVPTPGYFFVYPDFRQVEGRSMAVITQDQALLDIYAAPDADSHQAVADLVTAGGTPITRDQAKRTFFSVCYGVEAGHLSNILGCSTREAQTIIDAILRTFPGVAAMRSKITEELRMTRGVTTVTGWRRRWLGHVVETRGTRRGEIKDKVLKEALATKPQYMGARVLAQGLIQCAKHIPWIKPVAHIHDASLVEVPLERAAEGVRALEQHMTVHEWGMLFPVDASCGPNWYVASLSDSEKESKGYADWTRDSILSRPG